MELGFAFVGAVLAFASVALGAFGAHALKGKISETMLEVFHTGAQYEMYHSLALVAVGIMLRLGIGNSMVQVAGWLFVVGILLFSGSLYVLSITGRRGFGAITPLGGLCFLGGWALFAIGVALAM
ncbi:DUF423 domain-containing protein [Alicyclobacillus pomorum]|uniref:DUF423 domain-containing protein n=1 Tax=Alicyclobacillus pomorum TaxID=204470 RepID=UPI000478ADC4|nr:DUF423 domain-containing protein [Alicyclobacillus pomorum]